MGFALVLAALSTSALVAYRLLSLHDQITLSLVPTLVLDLVASPRLLLSLIAFATLLAVSLVAMRWPRDIARITFRLRWPLAVAVIVICTVLKLSGSSLGAWASNLPEGDVGAGLIMGVPRASRTDEWALFTGMAFAQELDPTGAYQYFGNVLRGTTTDMFLLYGQPVRNWAMVFRPFQAGYLMLGSERGLAFYWSSRLAMLFMLSFETGRLLTRDERGLSLGFAFLVAFAPVIQWWFSINFLVEMLCFAMGALLLFDVLLTDGRRTVHWACGLGISYCAVGYLFSLYPAWQVPLAWLLLACAVALFLSRGGTGPRSPAPTFPSPSWASSCSPPLPLASSGRAVTRSGR